jgi:hypothetical protein
MGIARSQEQKPRDKSDQEHDQTSIGGKSRLSDANKIINSTNQIAKCQSKNDDTNGDINRQIARWTRNIGWFTAALVIVTGGLVYVGLRADDTAREGERAFVAVRDFEIKAIGPAPNRPNDIVRGIKIIWENSGSTRTKHLRLGQTLIIPAPQAITWPPDITAQGNVLLPKQVGRTTLNLQIDGISLNSLGKGHGAILIFGIAKYEDAFDTRHLTLACNTVRPRSEIDYMTDTSDSLDLSSCEKYNCADSECYAYKDDPSVRKELEYLEGK